MGNIPNAKQSPRLINGVLLWYEGDTFDFDIHLNIKDQDGEAYIIKPSDTVIISFENARHLTVAEYSFTGISDNNINISIDDNETVKFPKGEYTYRAKLTWLRKTTIIAENKAVVE